MFSFRIRPLVCKRQNQSGTKTFRIHHKSGTISSSVNLVSVIFFWTVRILLLLFLSDWREPRKKEYWNWIGCHSGIACNVCKWVRVWVKAVFPAQAGGFVLFQNCLQVVHASHLFGYQFQRTPRVFHGWNGRFSQFPIYFSVFLFVFAAIYIFSSFHEHCWTDGPVS